MTTTETNVIVKRAMALREKLIDDDRDITLGDSIEAARGLLVSLLLQVEPVTLRANAIRLVASDFAKLARKDEV